MPSIPTRTLYADYIDDNDCFVTGRTPEKLYLAITGIKTDPAWTPDWCPPMNGTYRCVASESGLWLLTGEKGSCYIGFSEGGTVISAVDTQYVLQFLFTTFARCQFGGGNQFTEGMYMFYGGRAALTWK